jgi:hypothetical protein
MDLIPWIELTEEVLMIFRSLMVHVKPKNVIVQGSVFGVHRLKRIPAPFDF